MKNDYVCDIMIGDTVMVYGLNKAFPIQGKITKIPTSNQDLCIK